MEAARSTPRSPSLRAPVVDQARDDEQPSGDHQRPCDDEGDPAEDLAHGLSVAVGSDEWTVSDSIQEP